MKSAPIIDTISLLSTRASSSAASTIPTPSRKIVILTSFAATVARIPTVAFNSIRFCVPETVTPSWARSNCPGAAGITAGTETPKGNTPAPGIPLGTVAWKSTKVANVFHPLSHLILHYMFCERIGKGKSSRLSAFFAIESYERRFARPDYHIKDDVYVGRTQKNAGMETPAFHVHKFVRSSTWSKASRCRFCVLTYSGIIFS